MQTLMKSRFPGKNYFITIFIEVIFNLFSFLKYFLQFKPQYNVI